MILPLVTQMGGCDTAFNKNRWKDVILPSVRWEGGLLGELVLVDWFSG